MRQLGLRKTFRFFQLTGPFVSSTQKIPNRSCELRLPSWLTASTSVRKDSNGKEKPSPSHHSSPVSDENKLLQNRSPALALRGFPGSELWLRSLSASILPRILSAGQRPLSASAARPVLRHPRPRCNPGAQQRLTEARSPPFPCSPPLPARRPSPSPPPPRHPP